MRRESLILFLAFAVTFSQTKADEVGNKVYVPADNGGSPKILDTETGKADGVLRAYQGKRPADCPPDSYWASDEFTLESCADGAKFVLEPLESGKYPAGYMAVKPALPEGETREPGPHIENQNWDG